MRISDWSSDVCSSDLRTGRLAALRAMGADIVEEGRASHGGEPVADLVVRHAPLRGIEVPVALVPDMIDEFPILAIAAACARGTTVVRGAAEPRVQESDRTPARRADARRVGEAGDRTWRSRGPQ